MKILLINKLLYPAGGDAISTIDTGNLLASRGHDVIFWGMSHPLNPDYEYRNDFVSYIDFNNLTGFRKKLGGSLRILYSMEAKQKIEQVIKREKPDVVHLNNFAHQISPSILHVLKRYQIPVIMTMHDYKVVCASYSMLEHGRLCEACKYSRYYRCFLKGCVKESRFKSLLNTVEMYVHHKIMHIYDLVDIFISPSRFMKAKVEEMGFRGKTVYLSNFVNVEDYVPQFEPGENWFVYFGRLSKEKGLKTLIEAMKGLGSELHEAENAGPTSFLAAGQVKLKIIGEGPLRGLLESDVTHSGLKNVEFLGYRNGEELRNEIRRSIAVILPSEWYENNPRAVIEGFALGKLVIGARIGGIPELVTDYETGLMFESGKADDLRTKIEYILNHRDKAREMGKNARRFVERELNSEKHYHGLLEIYKEALGARANSRGRRPLGTPSSTSDEHGYSHNCTSPN